MHRLAAGALAISLFAALSAAAQLSRVTLAIDDIRHPTFSARGIRAELAGRNLDVLELGIGELRVGDRSWRDLRLECPQFSLEREAIRCRAGTLRLPEPIPLSFEYFPRRRALEAEVKPAPGESWRFAARLGEAWSLEASVTRGNPARLAPWLPAGWPRPAGGALSLQARLTGRGDAPESVKADLGFTELSFGDDAGLRAGEKLNGRAQLEASLKQGRGAWRANLEWKSGELFWQPVYLTGGGYTIRGQGAIEENRLTVSEGTLLAGSIGSAGFTGTIAREPFAVQELTLESRGLALEPLFSQWARPFLAGTALAEATASGRADITLRYGAGGLDALALELRGAELRDPGGRFVLEGVEVRVPWTREGHSRAEIAMASGSVLGIPLGKVAFPLEIEGLRLAAREVALPVLDGVLTLQDFEAELEPWGWRWEFGGGLSPVSMEAVTGAVGIHSMHGSLSGVIPRVRYARSTLAMEGALLIRVFDGTVVVKDLALLEPLGRAPRLLGELDARDLDLELLTRTFSFGSMQGRVDVSVKKLELSGWKPVQFDARIDSSPGDYRRRISQRAVQNIAALGGGGAAAAIQRGFLGALKEFGYSKIGLACRLERGVCHMSGVEDAPGGYVIVKGGGIPALTVMGYNRAVGWSELLGRLQRVTQQNINPVIK
ncbi:MAG TPA: hypothetical protein VLC55_07910 [Burkholderiales bacterium]|nr:hypothetical protein [Burkholderiales bacterium]